MTTEIEHRVSTDKSMASLAAVLREKGITAVETHEEWNEEGIRQVPTITLGFDDDGLEAADIAVQYGFPLFRTSYRYNQLNGFRMRPYWVMEFLTSCFEEV